MTSSVLCLRIYSPAFLYFIPFMLSIRSYYLFPLSFGLWIYSPTFLGLQPLNFSFRIYSPPFPGFVNLIFSLRICCLPYFLESVRLVLSLRIYPIFSSSQLEATNFQPLDLLFFSPRILAFLSNSRPALNFSSAWALLFSPSSSVIFLLSLA